MRARASLTETIIGAFHLAVLALVLPRVDALPNGNAVLLQSAGMVCGAVLIAWRVAPQNPGLASWMRVALTLLACLQGYERANVLVQLYHDGTPLEPLAMAADQLLFGGQPSTWMGPLEHPVLTELMQVSYLLYYVAPLVLAVWLLARGRGRAASLVMLAVVIATHLNFASYVLVPLRSPIIVASDPAYAQLLHYDAPLQGLWLAEGIRQWLLDATTMRHDCFPSGHTLLTVATLLIAWRVDRRAFAVLLPITLAIVFSTVYLRYHYAVDVLAGLLLAPIVAYGAVRLHRWWDERASEG